MNRSFGNGRSFLAIPFVSYFTRNASNVVTTRGISSMPPPSEPGTLGGIVVTVAEKLGIGE